MKKKILVFLLILLAGFTCTGKVRASNIFSPGLITIDTKDTVIFDLANAYTSGNYIYLPVQIISDDTINALDFALKFNESKLTYDSLITYKSYLSTLAYFNPNDKFLRLTSNSQQQYDTITTLVALRFTFVPGGCNKISKNDFFSITAYLNGKKCSYKLVDGSPIGLKANFTNSSPCSGLNISYNDASTIPGGTITSWSWNLGNGNTSAIKNPITTYTSTGSYTVTLVVTSNTGCKDTVSKIITINPLPVANFTSTSGCKSGPVQFTDNSTVSSGTITNWTWNFGDNTTSNVKNPSHLYASGGTYTVSLKVASNSGCSSSYTLTVTINILKAGFKQVYGCTGSLINFTDSSLVSPGTITGWSWNFGDGNTSTQQNPSHIYANAGTYSVSLKVSNTSCSDSLVKTIVIDNKPLVKFGGNILAGCTPLAVNFSDSSITSPGSTYFWRFGDTATSSSKNPVHTYTVSGVYTVKLYVSTASGCADSLIKTSYINVNSKPVASFTVQNACIGSTIAFKDNSTIPSGTITGWSWNFGDGNTSTQQNPSHIYANAGTYTVSLKVSNTSCSDSLVKTIVIDNKPTVKFQADKVSGCAPLTVNFSDSSITSPGSTYFWSFGGTDTSSSKNSTHTFTANGVYTVKHYVTTPGGCMDSLVKIAYITVSGSPVANFTTANGCAGSIINFTDSSTISSGTITNWTWNFGDGNTSTQQNPTHVYTSGGTYTVSLKVTNASQICSGSITKTLTIENKPIVKFGGDSLLGCAPFTVNFSDSSIAAAGSTYFWRFGDTSISLLKNTAHTYTVNGTYTVKHYVTTPAGCTDSLIKTAYIQVFGGPVASFTATPKEATLPDGIVHFTNLSSGYTTWVWNFGDSISSVQKNPSHTYSQEGIFTVCLMVKSGGGCSNTYCDTITTTFLNPLVIPKAFTPNGDNNNDILKVRGGPVAEMELRIFDNWGTEVFFSATQNEGWDGTYKGVPQPEGTYVYILKAEAENKKKSINQHGVLNLAR